MPNKNSKAAHLPIRTCVVCKKKVDQNQLLNFFLTESGIVFDFRRIIPGRRFYLCPSADCFKGLNKWRKGHQKRKIR
ncbi:MAG: YlxR family protein [Candidatus Cloacimonas sp.]|jgi:hypothetical protein|nr:YlxR family protein [Candidatus Cloacimonas sp.]HNX03280.1 YlxR family protein [Candidatus Cloacimonas sp.]HPS59633.1 YlxR family protein [Candidatus Cloacimonas sp.]